MREWEAKMYDTAGNEMTLKPGHMWVIGKEAFCQVPCPDYEAISTRYPKYQAGYGTIGGAYFITSVEE